MFKERYGIFLGILAALSYAILSTFIKMAHEVNNETLVFFRSLFSFIFLLPFLLKRGFSIKTKKPLLHLMRGVVGVTCLYCIFYSLKHLCLVDSVLLYNTIPIFMPFILLIGYKTKISRKRFIAALIGFVGVVFILKPNFSFFNFAGCIGLISGILGALAFTFVKKLSITEPAERIVFYFFLSTIIFSFVPMTVTWQPIAPLMWFYIVLIGLFAFVYHILITKAYENASATKVSLVAYTTVVFTSISEFIFWQKAPDIFTCIGALLIFGGAAATILDKEIVQEVSND